MDKDIKPYRQRGNTCAIACMMMVLEYYHLIPKANWYDEKRFYRIYGSRNMEGTPFSALAYHFSKNGLYTILYHSDDDLFNNNKCTLEEYEFKSAMEEYKEYLDRAISKGTKVIKGINIDSSLLKEQLKKGNIVILAGEISGILHTILLSGYEDNNFIVCDPLCKKKQLKTTFEIEKFMNTSIGKWFISVNDKNNR